MFSAYRSNLLLRIIKVGAQSPTKIPNLSPCACRSGVFPPVRYQIAIEAAMERNPRTRHTRLRVFSWCYSKGKSFTFNGDSVRTERKQKINIRTGQEYDKGTIPTCIWEKNNHTTSKEYCNWHPTQKPISILERFIEAYTNPGEVVLDIFNGTASTMVACENTGRIFKGCEFDKEYYDLSTARYTTLTGQEFKVS